MDILVIIILFRICYVATKTGLPVELFKLLGTILATYLSLHYFTMLSDFVRERTAFIKNILPLEFADFLAFSILAIIGYLVFVILREVMHWLIKMESAPKLNKWGGLVLGIGRGILFSSLVVFLLAISSIGYFKGSATNSYFGKRMFKVASVTYSGLWNGLMSKFMTQEKFNNTVLEVQEGFNKP